MKKIIIIIAVTTIPLITIIGGLYLFGTIKKQNYVQEAIDSVDNEYYQELARRCSNKDKSEYRCCLASVYDMNDLHAKLVADDVCEGMAIDQLKCLGSYKWCVPMSNVTSPDNDTRVRTISENEQLCEADSDCVPSECCHATNVVSEKFAPNCDKVICTMSCETTLDCGQGKPICDNGLCTVKIK